MAPKIGVVLSGCGVFDGSEIHESVLLLLYLRRAGLDVEFLAPDITQRHVIDHRAGAPAERESRNVLVESARIARGKARDLATAKGAEFDGIAFPGGFGAAKNLCSYAFDGEGMSVQPEVARLVRESQAASKPMLFLCIAPVIAAKVIGNGLEVTLGPEGPHAGHVAAWGGRHVTRPVTECHLDIRHRVVTAPAYMYHADVSDVAVGIEAAVKTFSELIS